MLYELYDINNLVLLTFESFWKLIQKVLNLNYTSIVFVRTSPRQNLSSGFLQKRDSNQSPQLHRLAIGISLVESLDMELSKKRITKALISLRGCAGWSAPLLFANPQRQVFSRPDPYNLSKI